MARLLRSTAVLLPLCCLGTGACESVVPLGTECPESLGACAVEESPVLPPEPDAGADLPEAAMPMKGDDAGPELPPWPPLENMSFELTSGSAGDLTTVSLNEIDPWEACQPLGAGPLTAALRVERSVRLGEDEQGAGSPEVEVLPRDGEYFVAASFLLGGPLPIPLVQSLAEPLRKGQRYEFAIDVRSASGGRDIVLLEAWGANTTCALEEQFASTPVIVNGDWQTVCLSFTPGDTYHQFALRVGLSLLEDLTGIVPFTSQLFLDNLRPAQGCP